MRQYLGKPYKIYENDCISLVCNFYKTELGIELTIPTYTSIKDIYKFTVDDVVNNKLKQVSIDNRKNNDILIFACKNKKNLYHLGIFFQPNKMLHVERDGISKYESISDFYWNRLALVLRGKDV